MKKSILFCMASLFLPQLTTYAFNGVDVVVATGLAYVGLKSIQALMSEKTTVMLSQDASGFITLEINEKNNKKHEHTSYGTFDSLKNCELCAPFLRFFETEAQLKGLFQIAATRTGSAAVYVSFNMSLEKAQKYMISNDGKLEDKFYKASKGMFFGFGEADTNSLLGVYQLKFYTTKLALQLIPT